MCLFKSMPFQFNIKLPMVAVVRSITSGLIQMVNPPAMFDTEARGVVSTAINSSPPSKTVNSKEESSDIESGFASFPAGSQTPPGDDDGKKETPSKNNGVNKTPPNDDHKGKDELEKAIMLGGQIISVAAAVWAKNSNIEMSREAKCLWYFLLACVVLSLISFIYGLFLSGYERLHKAARVMRTIGIVAMAFAVVTAIGLHLPNEMMVQGNLRVLRSKCTSFHLLCIEILIELME